MPRLIRSQIGILLSLVCVYCNYTCAAETAPAATPLSDQVAAAKGKFAPITPAMIQQARQQVTSALDRLDKYLLTGGSNGVAWKKYLLWDELAEQLKQPDSATDEELLQRVLRRYRMFYQGLELPVFTDVAKALDAFIPVTVAAKNSEAKTEFDAQVEKLSNVIAEAEKDATEGLSPEASARLGQVLGWLHDHRQLIDLVTAVRQRWSQPNMRFQTSKEFLAAGIARPLDETAPVRDVILGTNISGTGRTVGKVGVELIPNDKEAVIETVLTGTNHANTVGQNGPALVWSQGQVQLLGRKRLIIESSGIKSPKAVATASSCTQITGIGSTKCCGLMDRLVRRVASKKVPQQKGASEQVASQHAAQQLINRLEKEAAPLLAKANADLADKFRLPLTRGNEFPRLFHFSTTKDELKLVILDDDDSHLAATSAAPDIMGQPDLSVRLHESFVNNVSYSMLAGETFDQDDFKIIIVEMLGKLPPQMQDDEEREPWSITFDAEEPVTLRIADDTVTFTVRGASYTSGTKVYDAMNVTARYKIQKGDFGTVTATRGDLEILPPGFVPGGGKKLALRQIVLIDLLRRRFGKMFEETIYSDGLELSGNWKKVGKMPLTQLTTARGWIALGWALPTRPAKVADKKALPQDSVARLEQE